MCSAHLSVACLLLPAYAAQFYSILLPAARLVLSCTVCRHFIVSSLTLTYCLLVYSYTHVRQCSQRCDCRRIRGNEGEE